MDNGGGGGESGKLDNFHGRHMCIVPNQKVNKSNRIIGLIKRLSFIKEPIAYNLQNICNISSGPCL